MTAFGPTTRAAYALAAIAVSAILVPPPLALAAVVALASAVIVDAISARQRPEIIRTLPHTVSRGVPASFTVAATGTLALMIRQASPPDIDLERQQAGGTLRGHLIARRRGRHTFPPVAVEVTGPLGLASVHRTAGESAEVLAYPDMRSARLMVLAVRRGRFGAPGRFSRGPLGLGTDFESVRDYLPDDDIRQVNWRATARLGRPMSNQYRIEQDRDVVCLVDAGRLMSAPLENRTRLDEGLDAVVAVALTADEVGDRCGAIAFDDVIRRSLRPRRGGGEAVVHSLFDIEPRPVDSDYELAFRSIEGAKRALVFVFTDLFDRSASRVLVDAMPVLARRHAVVVATIADPDVTRAVATPPDEMLDAYRTSVALDLLAERSHVIARVRASGANVVEAPPGALGRACVTAYLRAKARARL